MALKADSAVPAAISAYHTALSCAESTTEPLQQLGAFWQVFQEYVEPHVLQAVSQAFRPWPVYQQALEAYAGLCYPRLFRSVPRPEQPTQVKGLEDWHGFFWPEHSPRLSVCLLVRNARDTLPGVLDALRGLGDEQLVLDTGSEDGTLEWLQQQEGVSCFSQPWPRDFAQARNQLLERACGDWVFFVDADERLLPAGADWLRAFVAYAPLGWQIYAGEVLHQYLDRPESRSWASRLFRHDLPGIAFTGALHEVPVRTQEPAWLLPVWVTYQLHHSGNLPEAKQRHRKAERVAWLEELVADQATCTPYLIYQLAHVLAWGHDTPVDLTRACVLLDLALADTLAWHGRLPPRWDWVPAPLPAVLLLRMQVALWLEDPDSLISLGERWGHLCPYREADVLQAMAWMRLGQAARAAQACYRCWLPESWSVGPDQIWQTAALEVLLESALLQADGLQALFAVRRLQELCGSGPTPRGIDLLKVKLQLERALNLRPGGWLERLQFEIQACQGQPESGRLAWLLMAGLNEAWRQDWLQMACTLFLRLEQPMLAEQAATLGRLLFPRDFQWIGGSPERSRLAAGEQAYWRGLLEPAPVRPRCQAAMMVRNAADTLPAALASVTPWVDSLLIADTGSEDATPELIREWALHHTVLHWHEAWSDDFSQVRQALLARAASDWLLMVDADDVLDPAGHTFWRSLTAYRPPRRQLFAVRYVSWLGEGQTRVDWATRLLHPQPLLRYWGAVHEQPGHVSDPEIWPTLPLPQLMLKHTGYLPDAMLRHDKVQRGRWLRQELRRGGTDNPYFCYQYAAWLAHHCPERADEAVEVLLQGLDGQLEHRGQPPVAGWFPLPLQAALVLLTRLLTQLQRPDELVRLARPWWEHMRDPEFFFWLGMAALRSGNKPLALQSLWRAGALPPGQLPQAGFHSWQPALGLAEWALQTGDWPIGVAAFQQLFALGYADAQAQWQRWWMQMNQAWNKPVRRSALS